MTSTPSNPPPKKRGFDFATPSVKDDYIGLPQDVKDVFNFALTEIQNGLTPSCAGIAGEGLPSYVWKLRERDAAGIYRVYYTLKLPGMVWVLHAFQKRSSSGKGTPKKELDLVRKNLAAVEAAYKAAQVAAKKAAKARGNDPKGSHAPKQGGKGKGKG